MAHAGDKRKHENTLATHSSDIGPLLQQLVKENVEESGTQPAQKKQHQRRTLFVRSLPPDTTTESLVSHFSQSFPIRHATAVIDTQTQLCKGFGFVTFADSEDAQQALEEFNGSKFAGKKLVIEVAEPRNRDNTEMPTKGHVLGQNSAPRTPGLKAKARRDQEKRDGKQGTKLIVRNLPWSIKKPEQLQKLFLSYGKVTEVQLPEKEPGLLRGFGFVTLSKRSTAEQALEAINGKLIDGRTLAVDWSVPKDVWQKANDEQNGGVELKNTGDRVSNEHVFLRTDSVSVAEHDVSDNEADGMVLDESDQEDEDGESKINETYQQGIHRSAVDSSKTLFIRNVPFEVTDDTLRQHFATYFGPVRYARVVCDAETEQPRGTAFVSLRNSEDALQCLKNAPHSTRSGPTKAKQNESKLELPDIEDPSGAYTMSGRVLHVLQAVDRSQASELVKNREQQRHAQEHDKRRLYLLSEGTIPTNSSLYQTLSQTERSIRESSAKQRKQLVQSNLSLHLSLTRLSVRNIPRQVTSKDLKQLAREAVVGFAQDVKAGKRERLSKEELSRGGDAMIEAERRRKQKGVGLVKQAKLEFEDRKGHKVTESSGAGQSRGYGFVEYHTHRAALMGLRWLNGHAIEYTALQQGKNISREEAREAKTKRLIVEFAIENAQVVRRRAEKEAAARKKPTERRTRPLPGEDSGLFTKVTVPKETSTTSYTVKGRDAKRDAKGKQMKTDVKSARPRHSQHLSHRQRKEQDPEQDKLKRLEKTAERRERQAAKRDGLSVPEKLSRAKDPEVKKVQKAEQMANKWARTRKKRKVVLRKKREAAAAGATA